MEYLVEVTYQGGYSRRYQVVADCAPAELAAGLEPLVSAAPDAPALSLRTSWGGELLLRCGSAVSVEARPEGARR